MSSAAGSNKTMFNELESARVVSNYINQSYSQTDTQIEAMAHLNPDGVSLILRAIEVAERLRMWCSEGVDPKGPPCQMATYAAAIAFRLRDAKLDLPSRVNIATIFGADCFLHLNSTDWKFIDRMVYPPKPVQVHSRCHRPTSAPSGQQKWTPDRN